MYITLEMPDSCRRGEQVSYGFCILLGYMYFRREVLGCDGKVKLCLFLILPILWLLLTEKQIRLSNCRYQDSNYIVIDEIVLMYPPFPYRFPQVGMRIMAFNNLPQEMMILLVLHGADTHRFIAVEENGVVDFYRPRTLAGDHQHLISVWSRCIIFCINLPSHLIQKYYFLCVHIPGMIL